MTTEDKTGQVFPGQPGGLLPCPTGWKALLWTEFFRVWLSCAQTQPEGWDALCSLQHHYLGNHTSRPCPSLSGRLKCLLFHSFQFCFFSKLHNPLLVHPEIFVQSLKEPAWKLTFFSCHPKPLISDEPNFIQYRLLLLYSLRHQILSLIHLQQSTTTAFVCHDPHPTSQLHQGQ